MDVLYEGSDVLAAASATTFDVIILDIMLPGRDGLSVLRQLRENNIRSAVLLLTARGEISERVAGLNAGADDYLPKPFVLAELVARVRAVGRRSNQSQPVQLRIGDLTLDTVTRVAKRRDQVIELTPREYRLLEFFDPNARPGVQSNGHCGKRLGLRFRSGHESRGCLRHALA